MILVFEAFLGAGLLCVHEEAADGLMFWSILLFYSA